MKTPEEIFKEHWAKVTDKPCDEVVMSHMKYAIDAMRAFAKQESEHKLYRFAEEMQGICVMDYKLPSDEYVNIYLASNPK